MDNVITFIPKKVDQSIEERINTCFLAELYGEKEHTSKCIYCLTNFSTAQMLYDILAKDMSLSAKNKDIKLTVWDLKKVLNHTYQLIESAEREILKERSSKEARKNREGQMRLIESRQSETEERDSESETGITTVTPPRFEK